MNNSDFKFELNHIQRDNELRKEQEYRKILDHQPIKTSNPNGIEKPYYGTCFGCNKQGHKYFACPTSPLIR